MLEMEQARQLKDRKRWRKNRRVFWLVKFGGWSVLLTLFLLIFYLFTVVAPIFSQASLTQVARVQLDDDTAPVLGQAVDDKGQWVYQLTQHGVLNYFKLPFAPSSTTLSSTATPQAERSSQAQHVIQKTVVDSPSFAAKSDGDQGWYAYGLASGEVVLVSPNFINLSANALLVTQHAAPSLPSENLRYFTPKPIQVLPQGQAVGNLVSSVGVNQAVILAQATTDTLTQSEQPWHGVRYQQKPALDRTTQAWSVSTLDVTALSSHSQKTIITPDGNTIYQQMDDQVWVLVRDDTHFVLRERVSIAGISDLNLLSGAYSLLVTQHDVSGKSHVSQWFDVLIDGERHLTNIRHFSVSPKTDMVIPMPYAKGFFTFDNKGVVQAFFTTVNSLALSQVVVGNADMANKWHSFTPKFASFSKNEAHLLTSEYRPTSSISDKPMQQLRLFRVKMGYPGITFSALWKKLWYEGYPEPSYVWQSIAASDHFEPKFSVIPLAFGTLKAALFAMIFAVPISIGGAIYTSYFMTPGMRNVIKPTIELMEAFPTVIIGFIAGIWLAPIVELNLFSTLCLLLVLPIIIIIASWLTYITNQFWKQKGHYRSAKAYPSAWLSLTLIPLVILTVYLIFEYGHQLEYWLLGEDMRYYLARIGVGFDQRNALVVGFAMGFAVIPTIFTISEDALYSVPKHLSDGAKALGATSWQCLVSVVLPTASSGLFSAAMMGLGRAVGETMIVLMVAGNTPLMNLNLFDGMRTLSANIAIEMPESELGGGHFRLLFLTALLLFGFTFMVNSLAEWVRQSLRERYRTL